MKEIALTRGQIAIIDDEDYDLVSQFHWYANERSENKYRAMSNHWGRHLLMHRLIMFPQYAIDYRFRDDKEIDHINQNQLDNKKSNLRLCNRSQNMCNLKTRKNKIHSIYKGVDYIKGQYRARIQFEGKAIDLGRFNNEVDAYVAYCEASKKYHGDFSCLG